MSAGFTPGPWRAFPMEKHNLKGFVIDTDFGNKAENDYVIADHVFGRQAEANAHLIAAAPALYAKLERAAFIFRTYAELHRAKKTEEGDAKAASNDVIAEEMEAAIAQARGDLVDPLERVRS